MVQAHYHWDVHQQVNIVWLTAEEKAWGRYRSKRTVQRFKQSKKRMYKEVTNFHKTLQYTVGLISLSTSYWRFIDT